MPIFEYTALDANGKRHSGVLDAESAAGARKKLRIKNIFPVSISEAQVRSSAHRSGIVHMQSLFQRIRPIDVMMMTRQMATLVSAGFPVVSALESLIPHIRSRVFQKLISQIKEAVTEGQSLSTALAMHPDIFSPLYINMVAAAEASGTLDIVLERLADISEKQRALDIRVRSALAYPLLMALVGIVVVFVLLIYVVPSITAIFVDFGHVLPLPTRILIGFSDFVKSYWRYMLFALGFLILGYQRFCRTERGGRLIALIALTVPGIADMVKKRSVARFARMLGSLLENGVSMLVALEIVKNITDNVIIAELIEKAVESVGKGESLAVSLSGGGIFPPLAIQMIQVGEQSGALEAMLKKSADVFDGEVEAALMSVTALLEPLMILFMGGVVGWIILSICMPIFEMNQLIH